MEASGLLVSGPRMALDRDAGLAPELLGGEGGSLNDPLQVAMCTSRMKHL